MYERRTCATVSVHMSVQSGRVRALRVRAHPCDPCEAVRSVRGRAVRVARCESVLPVRVETLSEKREVWDMQTMVHRPRRAARTTDDTRHTALIDFDSALVTHCKGSWPEPCGTGSDWLE